MNMQEELEFKTNNSSSNDANNFVKNKITHTHQSKDEKYSSNRNVRRSFRKFESEDSKIQNDDNSRSNEQNISFEHHNVIVPKSEANEVHSFSRFDLLYNVF